MVLEAAGAAFSVISFCKCCSDALQLLLMQLLLIIIALPLPFAGVKLRQEYELVQRWAQIMRKTPSRSLLPGSQVL